MTLRAGIDLGGTKIQSIVIDDANTVLGQARQPTPTHGGPSDVVAAMAESVRAAATAAKAELASLAGVGLGSPGSIDDHDGTVASARNLPNWIEPYPVAADLRTRLGVERIVLGNDVDVATDAEFAVGVAKPYSSILGVFWGTGVGGGVILNDQPWDGRGSAGEIGHVVIRVGGRRCGCGRRGCMEAYAGRMSMERRARKLHKTGRKTDLFKIMEARERSRLTSGVWWHALEHHDELATELVEEAIEALGAGVASALNVLDVEAVVIGGGMGVRFGEPYARRIEAALMPHLFSSANPPRVLLAGLGDLGGAIGASLLVAGPPAGTGPPG